MTSMSSLASTCSRAFSIPCGLSLAKQIPAPHVMKPPVAFWQPTGPVILLSRSRKQCCAALTMSKHRATKSLPITLQRLAELEWQVEQQKQLVVDLQAKKRRPTSAEAALKDYERTLLQLRNHAEIM